jgi:hypothetical protein
MQDPIVLKMPKQKVRSSAAHMPTRAMRDRSKYTRKGKGRWTQ